MIDMIKWLVVITIVIMSVILAGYYYYISLPISMNEYLDKLQDAKTLSIVMDLRGAYDNQTRHNILQCGVDFAGSIPLGGKKIFIYSLDNDGACIISYPNETILNTLVDKCIKEIYNTDQTIYIKPSNNKPSTTYYSNRLLISMTSDYNGRCGVAYG